MKPTALAPAFLLATLAAATAQAQSFNDHARVRAVEPQYEVTQVPRPPDWVTSSESRAPW